MRKLPWSFSWFVATGVIFVLQWIPFTGIFLMMLAAPFWSVITINLGFVGIAIEAAVGAVSRLWLLAPLAWFAGYTIAADMSEGAYQRLDAEIRSANTPITLDFDANRSSIVVRANPNELGSATQGLVHNYRVPVAYTDHTPITRRKRTEDLPSLNPAFRAYRIGGAEICARIRKDSRHQAANAWAHIIQDSTSRTGGKTGRPAATGLCSYSLPEEPSLPATRIEAKAERLRGLLLEGKLVHVTITAPGGEQIEVRSGQAAPLHRIPMPVIGCALNSGAPSWNCFAGFMKQSARGLGGTGAWGASTVEVIAAALKLEPAAATTRRDELASVPTSSIDNLLTRHEGGALANLDRIIADPTVRATVHDLAGLTERPHLLTPRADRMLEAMSAALAHGKGTSETARNLQRLLAALPASDFQRIGDDLLRRLDDGRPVPNPKSRRAQSERIDGQLLTRLGDLGSAALPVLERIAFEPRVDGRIAAVLGICRVGAPAASALAEQIAAFGRSASRARSDERTAAYVTLMRLGRDNLAATLIDEATPTQARDYARRWPGLTPGAGPQTCTLRYPK